MEQNDDVEIRSLLREWQAPVIPASVEERIWSARQPWWRFLLSGQIRIPVPVAFYAFAVLMAVEGWQWTRPLPVVTPRVVVKTEHVEVPVVREHVITKVIYISRPTVAGTPAHGLTFRQLKPVSELRPRIIRGAHDQN